MNMINFSTIDRNKNINYPVPVYTAKLLQSQASKCPAIIILQCIIDILPVSFVVIQVYLDFHLYNSLSIILGRMAFPSDVFRKLHDKINTWSIELL